MCIMKLVFIKIDCCDIVVKLLRDYCERAAVALGSPCVHDSMYHCGSEQGSQLRIEAPRSGAEDSSIYI